MQQSHNPYAAPGTRVRAEPLTNGAPIIRAPRAGEWAIGSTLIIFGLMGWLTGARYTLFGWVVGLNLFFAWLGLPIAIPTPAGWWILAMIPIGIAYSRVELQVWNAHRRRGQALALFLVGWLLIVATDVGTTYLGVRAPQPGAWPITQTIAANAGLAFVWSAVLTFASDWLIIGGMKLLRR